MWTHVARELCADRKKSRNFQKQGRPSTDKEVFDLSEGEGNNFGNSCDGLLGPRTRSANRNTSEEKRERKSEQTPFCQPQSA